MNFQERDSGLVVPSEPPKPQRIYGALEVKDEPSRQICREAFRDIYEASVWGIDNNASNRDGAEICNARRELLVSIEALFLGNDCSRGEST